MCQLLGMNSRLPSSLTLSFTGFSQRGGCTDHHADGWGIAFFESDGAQPGKGIRYFVDKQSAATSPIAQMLRTFPIKSHNVVAHVRKATVGHVTLENLKDERYSRNEAIVAVLGDMGFIERLGYGIDRMIAAMEQAGLPAPRFEETTAGFKVTLQSAGADLVSSQPQQQPWSHTFLNERQEAALAFVREHGRITMPVSYTHLTLPTSDLV